MSVRVAVFVLCLFVWNLTASARILLQQDPLLGALCGELRNEDPVQVFATPVDEIQAGMIVETCQGTDWFMGFLRGTSGTAATVDCGDDDILFVTVSNSLPASSNTCDLTEQYPQPDFTEPNPDDPPIAGGPICMPPPMGCSTNSGNRRRMQGLSTSRASSTSRSSNGNGQFELSVDVQESSTSGSSSASASSSIVQGGPGPVQASVSISSSSTSTTSMSNTSGGSTAGITACKAQCCVTTVVGGAMYARLYDIVTSLSCQGFPEPS